jgi:hypothetical protein
MYLDIHLNVVGFYGSSPSFLAPMAGWDICNMMCPGLAGGSGLEQAIVDADADMLPEGSCSKRTAGGESRRLGLKRKVGEITRSAAEDFALLTARNQHDTLQISFYGRERKYQSQRAKNIEYT